jgi:hypothetical protein
MATTNPEGDVLHSTHQCHALVQEGVQHHGAFFSGYKRWRAEAAQESLE